MLYGDPIGTIHGLDIYRDFSDSSQFYYLPPETPRIARIPDGPLQGQYSLRLVIYRRDISLGPSPDGVPDGGGFLALDVDLAVDDEQLNKVKEELQSRGGGQVKLTGVPFIDGAVSLTLYGRTSGDDSATATTIVRKVLGSTKPSLYGAERASFSAVLDEEGASLMKKVIEAGGLIMALVQYDLTYQEVRPAYNLKITIDYAGVYDSLREHFGVSASIGTGSGTTTSNTTGTASGNQQSQSTGVGLMAKAAFNDVMETLKSKRTVLVEETDFGGDPDVKNDLTPEQVNEIIADLMGPRWFKPTLAPPSAMNSLVPGAPTATPVIPQTTAQPFANQPRQTNTFTPVRPAATTNPSNTTSSDTKTQLSVGFEIDITRLQQTEKVTAVYDLTKRAAVTKQKHPNGQLVLDVGPDEGKNYVLEVSLKDDFFRRLKISATTNADWDADGISSIRVEIRYGPNGDGTFSDGTDLLLLKTVPLGTWETNAVRDNGNREGDPLVLWYEYRVTVNYKPSFTLGEDSGAVTSAGTPGADADGWIRSMVKNLTIDPRDVTPIHPVKISTGVLKFDLIQEVQMLVSAGQSSQTFRLSADSHDLSLVMRSPAFKTSGTVLFKDDPTARIELPEAEWSAAEQLVVVDEPFVNILRVKIIAADPGKVYSKITVTMRYKEGERVVTKDFDFTDNGQSAEFSVRHNDPDAIGYSYMMTTISASGAIEVTDWIDARDPVLIAGYKAVDVMVVTLQMLQTVPSGKLVAVQVFLEYDDKDNDVHWEESPIFSAGNPSQFVWTFPIQDRKKTEFRYRIVAIKQLPDVNEEIPWQTTRSRRIALPLFST